VDRACSSSSSSSAGLELETLEETYTSSLFRTEPLYQFYDLRSMGNLVREQIERNEISGPDFGGATGNINVIGLIFFYEFDREIHIRFSLSKRAAGKSVIALTAIVGRSSGRNGGSIRFLRRH
jgi:hypothetical protein